MKTLQGKVIGLSNMQTAKVSVERQWQHPLYGKQVRRTKKYACHYTGTPELALGDEVVIQETRPMSKTKRFKVVEKIVK